MKWKIFSIINNEKNKLEFSIKLNYHQKKIDPIFKNYVIFNQNSINIMRFIDSNPMINQIYLTKNQFFTEIFFGFPKILDLKKKKKEF